MYLLLALIIISSAIAVIFVQEFSNGFKKIFSIPGMPLFFPLFMISYLLIANQGWVLWGVDEVKKFLWKLVEIIQVLVPFEKGSYLFAATGLIAGTALIPHFVMSYKKMRRKRTTFTHAWLVSFVSWIVLALLIVSKS